MIEKKQILVVEDNSRLNDFISLQLKKSGYNTIQAFCGKEAYTILKNTGFDLIILDLKLGDMNGLKVLHTVRLQNKTIPVMIISSLSDDETKIEGFRIGCDDYLTKPFYTNEMLIRVKRMLERHEYESNPNNVILDCVTAGPFELDLSAIKVKKNQTEISMRKKFFDIFLYLIQHQNTVIPYRTLYEQVWGKSAPENSVLESNLYVNIRNLRLLIEDDPSNPKYIQSVRNVGYVFVL